jgi:hypothetical protein
MDQSECSNLPSGKSLRTSKLTAFDSKLIDRIFSFLDASSLLEMRLANKSTRKTIESMKLWCEKLVQAYLPDPSSLLCLEVDTDASPTRGSPLTPATILELRNKTNPIWFRYFISVMAICHKPPSADDFGSLMTALPRELLKTIQSTIG